MTTGTDDRERENKQQAETHDSERLRLPSSGLTGILGGSLEEQLARAQERLAFYESFDRLIQENITRSGELMREAIDLREQARFEIEHGRAESERRFAADRERQRDVLASILDQLDDARAATDRIADRVTDALADLAAPDSAGVDQAATPAAMTTREPSPREMEDRDTAFDASETPTPFLATDATPQPDLAGTTAEEPATTGTGSLPDPFAAYATSPGGEFALLETNLEEVVRQHPALTEEDAPAEHPPRAEAAEFLAADTASGADAPTAEPEAETAIGDAPPREDTVTPETAAAPAAAASPEPAQVADAETPTVHEPEPTPSPSPFPVEDTRPAQAAERTAPVAAPVRAVDTGAETPPDAGDAWPRPIMVLVHRVPRAAAALSLQRHLAGLGHVEGVEAREYAEGVLRLQVTVSRALKVDDLRAWDGGRGLEPIHVQDNVIEVKLPGAAGF